MKKILFILFFTLFISSPSFADEFSEIIKPELRKFEVINPIDAIDYSVGNIEYQHGFTDNGNYSNPIYKSLLNRIDKIPVKLTFYDANKNKISRKNENLDLSFQNQYITIYPTIIPFAARYYKIEPQKYSNIQYYEDIKKLFRFAYSMLNQALCLAIALDGINTDFNSTTGIINKKNGLMSRLNITEEYPDGFMSTDGVQIFFKELNSSCKAISDNENPSRANACSEIIIDINGKDLPNLESDKEYINDRFSLLLYPNKIATYNNSVERAMLDDTPFKPIISPYTMYSIRKIYNEFTKNIKIYNNNIVIVPISSWNMTKSQMATIELKFYDKANKLIKESSNDLEICSNLDDEYKSRDKTFMIFEVFKNTKYYDVTIINHKPRKKK